MSSVRGVNVGGNLFGVTDSTNIAPIETTNFATRGYAKDRCFIMVDGLLYRATAEIESGDPIVINGNCKRTTLDEIISVIETDSDLIAPTEDGVTSSADYVIGDEIVRSGILYKVISAITRGDAFAIGSNIDIAGSLTSQINALSNSLTAIVRSGSIGSVNVGAQIEKGKYFYLGNTLMRAKSAINTNATFTSSNCDPASEGGLNNLNDYLSRHNVNVTLNTAVVDSAGIYLRQYGGVAILTIQNLILKSDVSADTRIATLPIQPSIDSYACGKTLDNNDVFMFVNGVGLQISSITGAPANKRIYGTLVFETDSRP